MVVIVDKYVDFILVGDSFGMVMYGMESMVGVLLDLMIMYGKVVVCGIQCVLIVVDMFFGIYEESLNVVFCNVVWIMKEIGCGVVKFEGGKCMVEIIWFLIECGIFVMVYIGLIL